MQRVLTPADYRTMLWKNGGGRTTEIAVHPPGASIDDFVWRVSIADVDRDGAFSPFPGVDRTIVLLEGFGMRLRGPADVELTRPLCPHAFSGDDAIECRLVAGPVRDFNAMFRRDRARGAVSIVRDERTQLAAAQFRVVYTVSGVHCCRADGSAETILHVGHSLLVGDTAEDRARPFAIEPRAANAVAIVVTVDCR